MCLIFVGFVHNFGKRKKKIKVEFGLNVQPQIQTLNRFWCRWYLIPPIAFCFVKLQSLVLDCHLTVFSILIFRMHKYISWVHMQTKIIVIWRENTCDANFSRQITKSSSRFNYLTILFLFFQDAQIYFLSMVHMVTKIAWMPLMISKNIWPPMYPWQFLSTWLKIEIPALEITTLWLFGAKTSVLNWDYFYIHP